ncbi:DUF411 domain-containing protein [Providencia burhodogranariea]|uniref:Metal-binding protein n=1 Tax=Providencia burhodogranariea DSM 19968 TaxID=1141662 RepID=K8WDA3_9GAMM|nr:DUF411 domain-containing protein [Providencia burhodogranariea]EKT55417.1 hypothetical protein OOA_16539 [Providencia burhodogranariea DSM 19968]
MKKFMLGGMLLLSFSALSQVESVELYKDVNCGCCQLWGDAIQKAGYNVVVNEVDYNELNQLNDELKVPYDLRSCHIAKYKGKVIVGHVPVSNLASIDSLPDDAIGISVPGMPIGSLGMEQPSGATQPYSVVTFKTNGERY